MESRIDVRNADCMDVLKEMGGGGTIDLIVTDPPYEFNGQHLKGAGRFGNRDYFKKLGDLSEGVSEEQLDEMIRVMKKPNMYLWGNWKQMVSFLDYFHDMNVNTVLLSWHKSNPPPLCCNSWLSDTEYCLHVRGKGVQLYGGFKDHGTYWITPVNKEGKEKYGHPTVKPLDIIETFVRNSSLEGQTVCDPFLGSGTTAVACKKLGRNFIGCEKDPQYMPVIERRLKEVKIGGWFD